MKSALGEETKLVPPLEDILQRKLDQSRSHGGACDPAEVRLRYVGIYWIRELGVVEEIEELRPELERCVFPDSPHPGGFDGRSVKVELAWTKKDAHARVAETGSVANDGHRAERRGIDKAGSAAESAQPRFHATGRGYIGVGRSIRHLRGRIYVRKGSLTAPTVN